MIQAIIGAVASVTNSIVGAIDRGAQRRHEKDIMHYEATQYQTFYQFERSNTGLYVLLFIGLIVMFLLWRISILKNKSINK